MREQFTEKIIFEEISISENENGFEEKNWTKYYECWASKRDMSGREFVTQRAQQTEIITTFKVRHSLKIKRIVETYCTKEFRVKYKGNIYDIIYPYDIDNKHLFVEFKCKLVN